MAANLHPRGQADVRQTCQLEGLPVEQRKVGAEPEHLRIRSETTRAAI